MQSQARLASTRNSAEAAVTAVTESVMSETRAGNKVAIFGFGTFSPSARAARMGRNPQTGAPVRIAASKSVRFAPASAFKEALNSRGKAAAAKKAAPAKKAAAKKTGRPRRLHRPRRLSAKKAAKATKKR